MNNVQKENNDIEKLSELLALKLSEKLENKKISIEKSAGIVKLFLHNVHLGKNAEEIKKFIETV